MKRILFTLALALMGMNAFAQTITGRLVDDGGQPVAFANVALYRDTILISGTSSGEDGSFAVPLTPSGSTPKTGEQHGPYRLEASFVGYERVAVRCNAGDDLGTLTMNAKQLETVTITASRTTEEVNRYVVLPKPEEVEAAGRTLVLLDMLGLPGLKVDVALQSITVDGGLAILQIGGKEVPVARLVNLKAEQIKRVEYSNNPGIRYLDRGASGIVNIILKEREDGGSIVANGNTALTTGFANAYLQGSYHVGKSEFALEYSLGHRNYDSVPYEMEDSYLDPMRTVTRSQRTNMPFRYTTHDLTAEYTYQHDDSTMFVVALKDNFFTKTLSAYGTMTETDRGTTITQTLERQQHQRDNLPSLDLYFTHRMPRGRKVELNVVGEYSVNRYDNTLTYSAEGFAPATYATYVDGHGYALSAEGAYSVQLGTAELRTGLQYQHNFAANDYTLNGTTTSMTKDDAYLYAELAGNLGSKVGYSLGTGAKLFNVSDGTADGLGGHRGDVALAGYLAGYLAVGHRASERDAEHDFPHATAEGTGTQRQRRREAGGLAAEVGVEPAACVVEYGEVVALFVVLVKYIGKVLLTVEPETDECLAVAGQHDAAEGRLVVCRVVHRLLFLFCLTVFHLWYRTASHRPEVEAGHAAVG